MGSAQVGAGFRFLSGPSSSPALASAVAKASVLVQQRDPFLGLAVWFLQYSTHGEGRKYVFFFQLVYHLAPLGSELAYFSGTGIPGSFFQQFDL